VILGPLYPDYEKKHSELVEKIAEIICPDGNLF